ncbi:hypothetical protein R1sor_009241 [Riccia sorocarpa]|uniref:Uncharacterized protein n=1 Tax=Riccia sorocarpa TaxID=122646 RepID=A0ABD3H838_9MARC
MKAAMKRQEELMAETPVEENEAPKPPAENVVSGGSPGNVDCEADSPGYTPYSPEYVPNGPLLTISLANGNEAYNKDDVSGEPSGAAMWKKGSVGQEQENKDLVASVKRSEREAIRASSGRRIEVLVMASTDPVDEEARLRAALYDGNNELAKREIYDAHGKSQDARCHIRRAMQLVNYVLAPDDDTLDGRWKKKFDELEADGEVSAMEIVDFVCIK